ncbi:MAG TPA: UDP-N-acetylglucosamine 2-epimerase (non-hydrolyzing) [Vicinamibacterales bacterium]|nr:UDP-N-acetylglucosamine 2-epimerase (non-hydrolyzing) [Vicinamibacterales bacterium]
MRIVVVFGTRPEAIKLAPVVAELKRRPHVDVRVVTTAQHRELLDPVLQVFSLAPDCDLGVMQPRQSLAALSGRVLTAMDDLLGVDPPDVLIVQGDTTSAFICALAAFYRGVPVAHVEAGLRTARPTNPFPEEMNRRLVGALATLHFAPTERARRALLAEGIPGDQVFVTGNTVVDALQFICASDALARTPSIVSPAAGERLIVATLHRRESWGAPLDAMCRAVRSIVEARSDVRVVLPVHLNPAVGASVRRTLAEVPRVTLTEPLDYIQFVALMKASWIVLTDSGGVQEEAPALGKPVLVLRDTTERPEAVDEGVARLVGTDPEAIRTAVLDLLDRPDERDRMARAVSPFGDGRAAERIANILEARRTALAATLA